MQPEYLDRLNGPVQNFIRAVEAGSGVPIVVVPDPALNSGGPFGQGNLEVVVRAREILLHAPTNGYFPDGAVHHEVLHVKRCHVDGVPQLVLADDVLWNQGIVDMLSQLDNAVEHLVIVPEELELHPERRAHWESLMQQVCDELPVIPEEHLRLAICMHWAFLRHVLPDSPQAVILKAFVQQRGLIGEADKFFGQLMSVLANKEEVLRLLFNTFPQLDKRYAGLDYINNVTGTRHYPIP